MNKYSPSLHGNQLSLNLATMYSVSNGSFRIFVCVCGCWLYCITVSNFFIWLPSGNTSSMPLLKLWMKTGKKQSEALMAPFLVPQISSFPAANFWLTCAEEGKRRRLNASQDISYSLIKCLVGKGKNGKEYQGVVYCYLAWSSLLVRWPQVLCAVGWVSDVHTWY